MPGSRIEASVEAAIRNTVVDVGKPPLYSWMIDRLFPLPGVQEYYQQLAKEVFNDDSAGTTVSCLALPIMISRSCFRRRCRPHEGSKVAEIEDLPSLWGNAGGED